MAEPNIPEGSIERPDGSVIALSKLPPREQLGHELTRKLIPQVQALKADLTAFKTRAVSELLAHRDMMMDDYGVTIGGPEGNISVKSADGRWLVKYTVQKAITFGPELEAAKALIFECLDVWAKSAGDELRQIVTKVFALNTKGRIDTAGILGLRNLAIEDDRWKRAMIAIDDAICRDGSAAYINFYSIDPETKVETRLPLDIAKL